METKERGNICRLILAVIFGLLSLLLGRFAYKVDNLYNIYIFWGMIFPLLIARTSSPQYTFLSAVLGGFLLPFLYMPQRGYIDLLIGGINLIWMVAISIAHSVKKWKNCWYSSYVVYGTLVIIIYIGFESWYLFLEKMNPAPWSVGGLGLSSSNHIFIQYMNMVLGFFMLLTISEVILELSIVRKMLGINSLKFSNTNYRYVGVAIAIFVFFIGMDHIMDKAYSIANGVHMSFFKISTGESIKTSIIVALSSVACKIYIVSRRRHCIAEEEIREKQHEIQFLNEKLSDKVNIQNKQIKQAYADLEAYSYTVSHELKTPLREIDTYVEFVLEDNQDLQKQSVEDLYSVRRICKETIHLVKNMMEYAKVGYQVLNSEWIDLRQIVYECFSEIVGSEKENQLELIVYELNYFWGDRFLIKQMIFNIISNAVKYSSKKDHAKIVVGRMENQEEVCYYFYDNGAGFNSEYKDKLFHIFNRLHTEEEFEGSGIGLATVSRIVEKHDGTVQIRGELERGCTVLVSFPIQRYSKIKNPMGNNNL